MKFRIEIWTLSDLIEKYENGNINLNPPYQRRFIWTLKDQQILINSILKGYAIPNIFLQDLDGKLDMVDGQQRTRTVLGYVKGEYKNLDGKFYTEIDQSKILDFKIPITIIEVLDEGESIEEFYALVNKSGIHLNRPELKKAEYFETEFLKLITDLADHSSFKDLNLFTESGSRRMNDLDFVSELITQIKFGITDKKLTVDKLFEEDIDSSQYADIKNSFKSIIEVFSLFDSIKPLKGTRYKQRNDFYTLFGFINQNLPLSSDYWKLFYNSLLFFNDDINPSNEKCEVFQEYAFHCISQSNSKNARESRYKILEYLFLNKGDKPNKYQKQVLKFYVATNSNLTIVDGYLLFNIKSLVE